MIELRCPKCGEALSLPTSLAGSTETCPACGNICLVPQPPRVVFIAQLLNRVGVLSARAIGWCRRHRKLTATVAVNLILLTGLLSWLLPGWLPRPVVKFEAPARNPAKPVGQLPSRVDIARLLAERGYYLALPEPEHGILRGRTLTLWRFVYVLDANNPSWGLVEVWCPLDDREQPVAMSSEFAGEAIIAMADAAGIEGGAAAAKQHDVAGISLFEGLVGMQVSAMQWGPPLLKEMPRPRSAAVITSTERAIVNGFRCERIVTAIRGDKEAAGEPVGGVLILLDSSWP